MNETQDNQTQDSNTCGNKKSFYIHRHLQFTWWSLLCFVTLGIVLEVMHGLKIGWYLEEPYEIRRLMWTLAHAHGTLLSLVHAAFALTIYVLPVQPTRYFSFASTLLMISSVLLPGGFFLGGCFLYEGDPGLGIWLVPIGALSLLTSVTLTAIGILPKSIKGDSVGLSE